MKRSAFTYIASSFATVLLACGPEFTPEADFSEAEKVETISSDSSSLSFACKAEFMAKKAACVETFKACYCALACGAYVQCGGELWGCDGEPCLGNRAICFANALAKKTSCEAAKSGSVKK